MTQKKGKEKQLNPWKLVRSGVGPSAGQVFQHVTDPHRWNVKVFVGRSANGKKRYVSKVVYGSKKDANAMRLEMLHKKAKRQLPLRSSLTYAQLFEHWLAKKGTAVSPRTLKGYKDLVERHVLPTLGHKRVSNLDKGDFEDLYEAMQAGTHPINTGVSQKRAVPLSNRTVRLTHAAVRQSLAHAVEAKVITQNPVAGHKFSSGSTMERPTLTSDALPKFIEACGESAYGPFYRLLVDTGLRPGEACALTWDDINFSKAELKVTKTVTQGVEGQPVIAQPKTKRSNRTVAMMQSLVEVLAEHRRLQSQRGHTSNGLVFTNESGKMLRPWTFNKRDLRRIVKAAGITQNVTLYTLRHTFATSHLDTGTPLKQVSAWMGHSSIIQTADTYMHAADDTGKKWMENHEKSLKRTQ